MGKTKIKRVPLERFKSPLDDLAGVVKAKHWENFALEAAEPRLSRFDWREHGLAPRVRHQQDWNCCTSFALSAVVEMLVERAGGAANRLCGGYVHICLGEIPDPAAIADKNAGINPPAACEKAVTHGIKTGESDLPGNLATFCHVDDAAVQQVTGGERIAGGVEGLDALTRIGPLIVDMYVPREFADLSRHDVFVCPALPPLSTLHTMVLMGYDWPNRTATVLNSSGSSWGNDGFATVKFGSGQLLERKPFAVRI